jgi:hypothetical protein
MTRDPRVDPRPGDVVVIDGDHTEIIGVDDDGDVWTEIPALAYVAIESLPGWRERAAHAEVLEVAESGPHTPKCWRWRSNA